MSAFTMNPSQAQSFDPCPAGVTGATCYRVIDEGLQESSFGIKRRVLISWLTQHKRDDGEPFSVHATMTLSAHPNSTLVKLLTNWRGRPLEDGFDLATICGAPAMILVEHSTNDQGSTFANVGTIMPGKRADCPVVPPHIKAFVLQHPDRQQLQACLDDLSDSLKGKVSDGWKRLDALVASELAANSGKSNAEIAAQPLQDDLDDEIPF